MSEQWIIRMATIGSIGLIVAAALFALLRSRGL
jgi:hypothetical protein